MAEKNPKYKLEIQQVRNRFHQMLHMYAGNTTHLEQDMQTYTFTRGVSNEDCTYYIWKTYPISTFGSHFPEEFQCIYSTTSLDTF